MAEAQAKAKSPGQQLPDTLTADHSAFGGNSNFQNQTSSSDNYKASNATYGSQNDGSRPSYDSTNPPLEDYRSLGDSAKPISETGKPPSNNSYKVSSDTVKAPADNYKSTTESIKAVGDSYRTPAQSDAYNSEPYKQLASETPGKGEAAKQPSFQNVSRNSAGGQNYQQSQSYQSSPNYPQGYRPPLTAPPPLRRELSSTNLTAPRSSPLQSSGGPPSLQRQPSTVNTSQRSYMPSLGNQPPLSTTAQRAVQQPPRSPTSPYAAPNNHSSSSPGPRAAQQNMSQSYGPTRNPAQQRPSIVFATESSSPVGNLNYSSRGQAQGGNNDPNKNTYSNRNIAPNYLLGEDIMSTAPQGVIDSGLRENPTLQSKFKALPKQNASNPAETVGSSQSNRFAPSNNSDYAVDARKIIRTGSELKMAPPLVKRDSGNIDDKKAAEIEKSTKPLEGAPIKEILSPDLVEDAAFLFPEVKPTNENETFVMKSVKYFEENDKAKVPLIPKSPTFEKKARPSRPTHIDIPIVNSEANYSDDDGRGVDESPVKHPNLRSIGQPPKRVARILNSNSRRRGMSNPGTPTRAVSAPPQALSTPHTPKRQSHSARFKPEDELYNYFGGKKTRFAENLGAENGSSENGKESRPRPNGVLDSPKRTPSKIPSSTKKAPSSPSKTPLKSPGFPKSAPKTPDSPVPPVPLIKKVPMNKIQVGAAPSPNLKEVKSKIGSLANTTHRPGGGNIKIESHKVDFGKSAQARIAAKNDTYAPSGGEKKIQQVKLQWNAKPKVGSLGNASYKPGGGDKKIESVKLDFKDKAKSKVGSKDNVGYVPGGGTVKNSASQLNGKSQNIENHKVEIKAQSKVGSLGNVKHQPGGGDVKIFDDKSYIKQTSAAGSGTQNDIALSVEREVSVSDSATDISIKKTTTVSNSKPELSKTTHVTVVSRSPSKERRDLVKSPSTHEVKLTYSTVASPTKQRNAPVEPIMVVKIPVSENAPILNPSAKDKDASGKPDLPLFLSSSSDKKEIGKPVVNVGAINGKSEPPLEIKQPDSPISKFLQNEIATHEKVGEIWKEVQSVGFQQQSPLNSPQQKQFPPIKQGFQQPQTQPQQAPQRTQPIQQFQQQLPPTTRPVVPQPSKQPEQLQRSQPQMDPSLYMQRPQQPDAPYTSQTSNASRSYSNESAYQNQQPQMQHPPQQRIAQQPNPTMPIQRPLHPPEPSQPISFRPQVPVDNNSSPKFMQSNPRIPSPAQQGPRPQQILQSQNVQEQGQIRPQSSGLVNSQQVSNTRGAVQQIYGQQATNIVAASNSK